MVIYQLLKHQSSLVQDYLPMDFFLIINAKDFLLGIDQNNNPVKNRVEGGKGR